MGTEDTGDGDGRLGRGGGGIGDVEGLVEIFRTGFGSSGGGAGDDSGEYVGGGVEVCTEIRKRSKVGEGGSEAGVLGWLRGSGWRGGRQGFVEPWGLS